MVQYVFTPWRDRRELLLVREQFYGKSQQQQQQQQQQVDGKEVAVARVSMWMQRGNCPHMVESTALLMAAILSDGPVGTGSSTYAVRAAYSAAFSRFVTGLLDGHQDKLRKQSMYSIAKVIGLPATFVELRHQATHEQLPSLAKLRTAANKALQWIWEYYWVHLTEQDDGQESEGDGAKKALMAYLREDDEAKKTKRLKALGRWKKERLLEVVKELQKTLPGNQAYLRCAKLMQDINEMKEEDPVTTKTETEEDRSKTMEDDGEEPMPGWSRHQGPWKPKPIGTV